jgi:hypothetical protein
VIHVAARQAINGGGRSTLLAAYGEIGRAPTVAHEEVVELVRSRRLQRRGIGWIDAHLLASTLVAHGRLWTADAALVTAARDLRVAHVVS